MKIINADVRFLLLADTLTRDSCVGCVFHAQREKTRSVAHCPKSGSLSSNHPCAYDEQGVKLQHDKIWIRNTPEDLAAYAAARLTR